MFFEFLNAVITLDLNWLAWLFFSNFHYLFLFVLICFFFFGPSIKKVVIATALFCPLAWVWVDFEMMSGWFLFVGGFLGIYYITKMVVLMFAEDVPALRKHLVIISELQFVVLFLAYNLILA